jgi:hypothetical protein
MILDHIRITGTRRAVCLDCGVHLIGGDRHAMHDVAIRHFAEGCATAQARPDGPPTGRWHPSTGRRPPGG